MWVYQLTVIALFDRCFLQRIDLELLKDRGVQLLENNGHPWNVIDQSEARIEHCFGINIYMGTEDLLVWTKRSSEVVRC